MFHKDEVLLNQEQQIGQAKKNVSEYFRKLPLIKLPFLPPLFFFLPECESESEKLNVDVFRNLIARAFLNNQTIIRKLECKNIELDFID